MNVCFWIASAGAEYRISGYIVRAAAKVIAQAANGMAVTINGSLRFALKF